MVHKYREALVEGKIYFISNLRVGSCSEKFRPIPTAHKLFFRFNTRVEEVKEPPTTFPVQKFHFADSELLAERLNNNTLLSGMLTN